MTKSDKWGSGSWTSFSAGSAVAAQTEESSPGAGIDVVLRREMERQTRVRALWLNRCQTQQSECGCVEWVSRGLSVRAAE